MNEKINLITDGKYKKFKIILRITLVLLVISGLGSGILANMKDVEKNILFGNILLSSNILMCLWIEGIYYLVKFFSAKKSVKLAIKYGYGEFIDEIIHKKYVIEGKIAFSKHFFYDLRTNMFIAYSDIIWIYYKDGGNVIKTVYGKTFRSKMDVKTINTLEKVNPYILWGKSSDNYKDYVTAVTTFRKNKSESSEAKASKTANMCAMFFEWLSTKVHSRIFYVVGYTFMALSFISFIIIVNNNPVAEDLPGWTFFAWLSVNLLGLICIGTGYKVSGYEPKKYSESKNMKNKKAIPNTIHKRKNFSVTNISVNKQDEPFTDKKLICAHCGYNLKLLPKEKIFYHNSVPYCDICYQNIFLAKKRCKFCKKEFAKSQINENGYCPYCAEHWWENY